MRRWGLLGLAVLLAGLAGGPSSASPAPEAVPAANASVAAFVRGPLRGVVSTRLAGDRQVDLRLSLHRLDTDRDYAVAGSARPCPEGYAPGPGDLWSTRVSAPGTHRFLLVRTHRFVDDLATQRSVRVFGLDPIEEIACVAGVVGHLTPPPASAPVNASVATFVRGPIRGVVHSRPLGETLAGVRLSLEGLAADSTYLVIASTRRCGQPSRVVEDEVWATDVDTNADGGPVFADRRTERRRPFGRIRSTRIALLAEHATEVEQVCVPGAVGQVRPA